MRLSPVLLKMGGRRSVAKAGAQATNSPEELLRLQTEEMQDIKARNTPQVEVRAETDQRSSPRRQPVESPYWPITDVVMWALTAGCGR